MEKHIEKILITIVIVIILLVALSAQKCSAQIDIIKRSVTVTENFYKDGDSVYTATETVEKITELSGSGDTITGTIDTTQVDGLETFVNNRITGSGSSFNGILQNQIFNPASIVFSDSVRVISCNQYIQTGEINFSTITNNYGQEAVINVEIITNGDDINFNTSWAILANDYLNDSSIYALSIFNLSDRYYVVCKKPTITALVPPEIQSFSLDANNNFVDVTMSEGIYGANDGSTPLSVSDLQLTNINLGNVSAISLDSIKNTSNNNLSGGELVIRNFIGITGTPNGTESFQIQPIDGLSIFDADGNNMASTETTGTITLNNETIPTLTSHILDSTTVLSETEIVLYWTDYNTLPNEDSTQLQIDTTGSFNSPLLTNTYIAQDVELDTFKNLTTNTNYYFRGRPLGNGITSNTGNWSNILNDTTNGIDPEVFAFTITTATPSETFTLPLPSGLSYNFTVSWGDESSDVITAYNQVEATHTYTTSGTYQIMISGTCQGFSFNDSGDKTKIISVDNWGNISLTTYANMFYGCSNLISVPNDTLTTPTVNHTLGYFLRGTAVSVLYGNMFSNLSTTASLFRTFQDMTSLTTIGSGIFNTLTSVTTIEGVFQGCSSLTSIPLDIFDNMTGILNAAAVFFDCDLQIDISGLFDNCTSITTFNYAFYGNGNLTSASGQLWLRNPNSPDYNTGTPSGLDCYALCTGLSDYASIPTYWK